MKKFLTISITIFLLFYNTNSVFSEMPEGGKVNPDGTLEPVPPGMEEKAPDFPG